MAEKVKNGPDKPHLCRVELLTPQVRYRGEVWQCSCGRYWQCISRNGYYRWEERADAEGRQFTWWDSFKRYWAGPGPQRPSGRDDSAD